MKERNIPTYLPDQQAILELEKYGRIKHPFKIKTSQNKSTIKQQWKKPKKIYDKQNLLDMISKEKNRKKQLQYQNQVIKDFIHSLTHKKQATNQNQACKTNQSNKKKFLLSSLQEQLALLKPKHLELSNQISEIKKSKKYTKFMETKAELIQCQQQLNTLKGYINDYRKQNYKVKRMIKQAKFRNQDLLAMNTDIQIKAYKKKQLLQKEIDLLDQEIFEKKKKKQQMERVKNRVVQEIAELKAKISSKKAQQSIQQNTSKGIFFRKTPNCKISATYCCHISPCNQQQPKYSGDSNCKEHSKQYETQSAKQQTYQKIEPYLEKDDSQQPSEYEQTYQQNSEQEQQQYQQYQYENQNGSEQYEQSYGWTVNYMDAQQYQNQSFNDDQQQQASKEPTQNPSDQDRENKLSIDQQIEAYDQFDSFSDD